MRDEFTFSFVIPTRNNAPLLANTLEALCRQEAVSRSDFEVIIADDGSEDRTGEVVEGFQERMNVRHVFIPRTRDSSRARTRNTGWRNARGTIIVFIDSDIIVGPSHLRELLRCYDFDPSLVVLGNRLMLDSVPETQFLASGDFHRTHCFRSDDYLLPESRFFMYNQYSFNLAIHWHSWMHVYSCNMAVRRSVLEQAGGFDEAFVNWGMEDVELGYRLHLAGQNIVHNSRLEVHHQYHGQRNDFIIAEDKKDAYYDNVRYFLGKHPHAVRIHSRLAPRFFAGELPLDFLKLHPDTGTEPRVLEFTPGQDLAAFIELMKRECDDSGLTIIDSNERTDLDLWIQCLGKTLPGPVRYFPRSKILDPEIMVRYTESRRVQTGRRRPA